MLNIVTSYITPNISERERRQIDALKAIFPKEARVSLVKGFFSSESKKESKTSDSLISQKKSGKFS